MEFQNAFTAGIQPGGLTNDFEVQVFVCYLLMHIGSPVSFSQLGEIVQTDGMVNYFEFASAISHLKEAKKSKHPRWKTAMKNIPSPIPELQRRKPLNTVSH